ncbi:MAG TPA: VOC family protein, partial [Candidatus Doudnabacteria bacterium]|nr:VOC family protein [Candidatus Doudnabacteria bacterium]
TDKIMNIVLPILDGHTIMGTDAIPGMGFEFKQGNNMYIMLEPDSRADSDRLFNALSEGGKVEMPMQDMFWGDYYGSFTDRFGAGWMINCSVKE